MAIGDVLVPTGGLGAAPAGIQAGIDEISANIAVVRDCLSPALQHSLINTCRPVGGRPGRVVRAGVSEVDITLRRCGEYDPAPDQFADIRAIFLTVAAWARRRFGVDVASLTGPFLFGYGPGGFFRPHRDTAAHPNDPDEMRRRALSLVLFVNDRDTAPPLPSFDGGALVLYDQAAGDRLSGGRAVGRSDRRHVIIPRQGALVVFRSHLLHEVREVRNGTRCVAAGWLCVDGRPEDFRGSRGLPSA